MDYNKIVQENSKEYKLVKLNIKEVNKVKSFINDMYKQKSKESHRKIDSGSYGKRMLSGFLGEYAVLKYLGFEDKFDWTIGSSNSYNFPDLKELGLNVGVKTSRYGTFPIVFKRNEYAQVIVIMFNETHLYICGIASAKLLNTYQSDELIKSDNLRSRGVKTGFYGLNKLEPLKKLL